MNRNQMNRFSMNPTNIDIQRSKFDRKHSLKFSANVGDIVPIYVDEVLPGDTFQMDTSKVVRMQPMVTPVMDNLYLDTYYFFVPNRLVWDHWKEFMGENSVDEWIPSVEYTIPQLTAPEGGFEQGSIADYFGLPTKVAGISVSALPFRAYALICSEWFRDENVMPPVHVYRDDTDRMAVNATHDSGSATYHSNVLGIELAGNPYKASKYHDYFTSALPSPQKGPDVTFSLSGNIPVRYKAETHDFIGDQSYGPKYFQLSGWGYSSPATLGRPENDPRSYLLGANFSSSGIGPGYGNTVSDSGTGNIDNKALIPVNLWADTSNVSMFNVNELRTAFAIQRYYEKLARGGSRYIEMIKAFFGVQSPDSRLQRPEYLGGSRLPINVSQVEQTSASETGLTPQGNVSGMSLTGESHSDFTYSATEHGYIFGVCVMRYNHTYQQGIERFWSRKTTFDFYNPSFANLGEMSILEKEIYATGDSTNDDVVFGYQEAWADYRYKPSHVTGSMRTNAAEGSLDVWHFADYYDSAPRLSGLWMQEDKNLVDRSLAVTSEITNQYFGDIYFDLQVTRPMPLYSIPGLIDHH